MNYNNNKNNKINNSIRILTLLLFNKQRERKIYRKIIIRGLKGWGGISSGKCKREWWWRLHDYSQILDQK